MDTTVDRNEKIWAPIRSGTKVHAFVQTAPYHPGFLRAMCRENYRTPETARFRGQSELYSAPCGRCLVLAEGMWNREEASMAPVDTHENPTASQDYYAAPGTELDKRVTPAGPAVPDAICVDCNERKPVAYTNYRDQPFCAGCIALHGEDTQSTLVVTMCQPAARAVTGWVQTIDGRMIGFRPGQEPVVVSTEGIVRQADGTLRGSLSALRRVFESGAAVMDDDGDLTWAC